MFTVGKSIHNAAGEIYSASTESSGSKYVLKVRNEVQIAKLLNMTQLIDGTAIEVALHPTLNFCRCIVYCPETSEMTKEELLTELAPQGVTDLRQFTRMVNGERRNTPTLLLTIKGTCVPQYIKFGALRVTTRLYIPPPMLCYGCLQYGHTKARCQATPRCHKCSDPGHNSEECSAPPKCFHCDKQHKPVDRNCPIYKMEEEIVRIKVERGLSHAEARKMYDARTGNKSYANIVRKSTDDQKDMEIAKLKEEVATLRKQPSIIVEEDSAKDKEIKSLKKQIANLHKQLSGVMDELKRYATLKCNCRNKEEAKSDPRNKRSKETSPGAVPEYRQPPVKKLHGERLENKTSEEASHSSNDNDAMMYESDSEVIVVNRKGKDKHHRQNESANSNP